MSTLHLAFYFINHVVYGATVMFPSEPMVCRRGQFLDSSFFTIFASVIKTYRFIVFYSYADTLYLPSKTYYSMLLPLQICLHDAEPMIYYYYYCCRLPPWLLQ